MSAKHKRAEFGLNVSINVTEIERMVTRGIEDGIHRANEELREYLEREVSKQMMIQMRKALGEVIKREVAKQIA